MGISGIGPGSLLLILVIIILLFGTKKLRGIGSDLGGAVKGFKKAVSDEDKQSDAIQNKSESDKVTDSEKKHDKV